MAYQENKKYASRDSYFDFSGIDLDIELKGSQTDNKTKAVDIFVRRVTEWLYEHINDRYEITEWDDNAFKKAIHYQIDYIRRNGDLSIDASNNLRELAPNAFKVLRNAAMANPLVQVKRRYRRWR